MEEIARYDDIRTCMNKTTNPSVSICELYGKLVREKGYTRNPGSLYRVFVRLGYRQQTVSTKEKIRHNKPYDTPKFLGIKWQLDVKYVPKSCYSGKEIQAFYQYTVIDEASRERFIYAYLEQNGDFQANGLTGKLLYSLLYSCNCFLKSSSEQNVRLS